MEQVKLWLTNEDGAVEPLPAREHIEYEEVLEEMLATRPDMLGDDVALVGRQLRTDGGSLDLLGIDQDGKLVVYELKRGVTPRVALSQAIDYASWLDSLDYDELDRRISEHRPKSIKRDFDSFDEWYADRFVDDPKQWLRPTRIVLVGLGVESGTERMAQWLSERGLDIEAIAFHAFDHDGRTVLARHVEVSSEDAERTWSTAASRRDPYVRAVEFGAEEVLRTAVKILEACFTETEEAKSEHDTHAFKNGFNFVLPPTDDRDFQRYPSYVGAFVRTTSEGMLNIYVRPTALVACPNESEALREEARKHSAPIRQNEQMGTEIGVDASQLELLAPALKVFVKAVIAAWQCDWDEWNAGSSAQETASADYERIEI